jgi:hypothetical protein
MSQALCERTKALPAQGSSTGLGRRANDVELEPAIQQRLLSVTPSVTLHRSVTSHFFTKYWCRLEDSNPPTY